MSMGRENGRGLDAENTLEDVEEPLDGRRPLASHGDLSMEPQKSKAAANRLFYLLFIGNCKKKLRVESPECNKWRVCWTQRVAGL